MHRADRDRTTDLDRRLRRALEAPPGAARRVAARALAGPRHRRWPLRLAVAAAAITVLAAGLIWLLTPAAPPPVATVAPPAPQRLTITNHDGVVTVRSPAGATLVLIPGDRS
jgi:hypothetical protein